jgi:hypothetical protein
MIASLSKASVLAAAFFAAPLFAFAASPQPSPKPVPMPTPHFPNRPLHVQLIVEVNDRGQVVRVDHGTLSTDEAFNTMTLGNAMQMWIRHPDGSAQTGLYSVTYDYSPHTHDVARVPTLIKPGGNWADKPGAATMIVDEARKEVQQAEARIRADQAKQRAEAEKHLPDINAAVKRAMTSPTPHP